MIDFILNMFTIVVVTPINKTEPSDPLPDKDALTSFNPKNINDDDWDIFHVSSIVSKSPRKGKKVYKDDVFVFLRWS